MKCPFQRYENDQSAYCVGSFMNCSENCMAYQNPQFDSEGNEKVKAKCLLLDKAEIKIVINL